MNAEDTQVRVAIPVTHPTATKTWRRTITEVNTAGKSGYAIKGDWVDPGGVYVMRPGGLIIAVDTLPALIKVAIYRVLKDGALKALGEYDRKGHWSTPAMINRLARLLAKHPWPGGKPTLAQTHVLGLNEWPGQCRKCGQWIGERKGIVVATDLGRRVEHPAACPPLPALRNDFGGMCGLCGGWVAPREGQVIAYEELAVDEYVRLTGDALRRQAKSKYVVLHDGECPPVPAPHPDSGKQRLNGKPGACVECGTHLPIDAGRLDREHGRWRVYCKNGCPDTAEILAAPVTLRTIRGTEDRVLYRVGQTVRVAWRSDEDEWDSYPHHGVRVLPDGRRSAPAVVLRATATYVAEEGSASDYLHTTLYRPATEEEAVEAVCKEVGHAHTLALVAEAEREILLTQATTPERDDPILSCVLDLPSPRHAPERVRYTFAREFEHLRVDRDGGRVWVCRYNGADGDAWAWSNISTYIARWLPLTPGRAALVDLLAAAFGVREGVA